MPAMNVRRTRRGVADPRLPEAMAKLATRDPKRYNVRALHTKIARDPEMYCSNYSDDGRVPSESTFRAAAAGQPIDEYYSLCIKNLLRSIDSSLFPRALHWVDLDLPGFFGTSANKMAEVGRALEGDYQTYSQSLTEQNHIRCGRITFRHVTWIDPEGRTVHRFHVEEKQYRPSLNGLDEREHIWTGHAAPRGRSLFMAMRCEDEDLGDGRGILGIAEVKLKTKNKIQKLEFYAQVYEVECSAYCAYKQIFVRRDPDKIKYDFIPILQFEDEQLLRDMWVYEKKMQLQAQRQNMSAALKSGKKPSKRK